MDEATALKWVRGLMRSGRLAEVREDAGLSQSVVARALGIHQSAVSRWESGQAHPRGRHAVALRELIESPV
jgi:DNA-binding transcriptional regulator YiaG